MKLFRVSLISITVEHFSSHIAHTSIPTNCLSPFRTYVEFSHSQTRVKIEIGRLAIPNRV